MGLYLLGGVIYVEPAATADKAPLVTHLVGIGDFLHITATMKILAEISSGQGKRVALMWGGGQQ